MACPNRQQYSQVRLLAFISMYICLNHFLKSLSNLPQFLPLECRAHHGFGWVGEWANTG